MNAQTPSARLTVGKLAAMADVSANAVRFYEREGLMKAPAKSSNGYRLYPPEAAERLRFIKQAQVRLLEVRRHGHRGAVFGSPQASAGSLWHTSRTRISIAFRFSGM